MRKVVYGGAMSLDGFIAGPKGEYDWIVMDPDIDFATMARFDTFLIGRKTFEAMRRMGGGGQAMPGVRSVLFSRTLQPADCPKSMTLSNDAEAFVKDLRQRPGKDIAIFGGGELFRSLLAAGLVDEVGFAVIPVLLGGGIPMLPAPADRATLKLKEHRVYEKTGTVALEYEIVRQKRRGSRKR
jgi:dihydrofolate reductase